MGKKRQRLPSAVDEVEAVVWHAIARVASSEAKRTRPGLAGGYCYEFELAIVGQCAGQKVSHLAAGELTVEEDGTTTATPGGSAILAAILAIVGPSTRKKIALELAGTVGKKIATARAADAADIMATLRKRAPQVGSVKADYELGQE
jgi:hypothetical protein